MGLAGGDRPHPRAIIFDLDRCLIDSRNAWRYCIEESIAACSGRRVDAGGMVDEYHIRPWRDVLGVLAQSREEVDSCIELCGTMFERSAMKKLLVHEGVGMALDALRGERIELGGISRLPHALTVKQVQSTGLDRFLAVVASTQAGQPWRPAERVAQCLTFLETTASKCGFLSGDLRDLRLVEAEGVRTYASAWAAGGAHHEKGISAPGDVLGVVMRDWALRR